jgi:hypothetical protein
MTESIGPQRPGDVRGWLVFDGLPADMHRAEDSTLEADHRRIDDPEACLPVMFTRAATDTEMVLLQHLGYAVPTGLRTTVTWLSFGLRNRRWPTLEGS